MESEPVLPLHGSLQLEQAVRMTAQAFESAGLNYGHGTDNALDEASWLLLYGLDLPVHLAPDYTQSLAEPQRRRCNQLIHRRIQERIPVAYITGSAWFGGHEFYCDERALVPRSPLAEFIAQDFFGLFTEAGSVLSSPPGAILDLCCGGGCIGITCALTLPQAAVVCADISPEALLLAASNVSKHQVEGRVTLCESDVFSRVTGRFDLIISNPPYVDACDIAAMPEEFHAEPMIGLAAGDDGLDLVHTIMQQATHYLNDDGWLVVEVGNSQAAMMAAYSHLPLTWLEFSHAGQGVFAISASALVKQ